MQDLPDRLRHFRTARGLTLRALARELNLNHMTVCNWELGRTAPRADRIQELADVLGITVAEFFAADVPNRDRK